MKKHLYFTVILCLSLNAVAADWTCETVDYGGNVGDYSSIQLDTNGFPHIGYYSRNGSNVKYACWNGSSWELDTVDNMFSVGRFLSMALDSNDIPHFSYFQVPYHDLQYAVWNGSEWEVTKLDSTGDVGFHTSIAVDSTDNPHITYYDDTNWDLKYAHWNGSSWETETVDTNGDVGMYSSLTLDGNDYPHVIYYDYGNDALNYAAWNGSSWYFDVIDEDGDIGSLALDDDDRPYVAYCDFIEEELLYGYWNGYAWVIESVDTDISPSEQPSLRLDSAGHPHIAYVKTYQLGYAYWNGSSWETETVPTDGHTVSEVSLALNDSGEPFISCYDLITEDLIMLTTSSSWDIESVELAVNPSDNGVLLAWSVTGDTPSSIRVLRGESDPVAVSGSLPGGTTRWLDLEVEPGEGYVYWLEATDSDGHTERFGPTEPVVLPEAERALTLEAPWPNPAADGVSLSFELPSGVGEASITIYDLSGRIVECFSIASEAGRQTLTIDTAAYRPGVYLATLTTNRASETRRFVISR